MVTDVSRDPVRIGVVGLNYWGPNLARNVDRLPGAELTWCCDLDDKILARMGAQFPDARTTTELDDVLADDSVDAVIVATSVSTRSTPSSWPRRCPLTTCSASAS